MTTPFKDRFLMKLCKEKKIRKAYVARSFSHDNTETRKDSVSKLINEGFIEEFKVYNKKTSFFNFIYKPTQKAMDWYKEQIEKKIY